MFEEQRRRMVQEQLASRHIVDERVLAAFFKVPRHLFIPPEWHPEAYADRPIPIGEGQTISQPYMVALMTQLLKLQGHERVLEIGTGSGYQTAILAELALEGCSVGRVPGLSQRAAQQLEGLGYFNVHINTGNGSLGWPEPGILFEGILVTAGAPQVPASLVNQLGEGGRLVIPVGSRDTQTLTLVEKRQGHLQAHDITNCVFVPLIGEQGWEPEG